MFFFFLNALLGWSVGRILCFPSLQTRSLCSPKSRDRHSVQISPLTALPHDPPRPGAQSHLVFVSKGDKCTVQCSSGHAWLPVGSSRKTSRTPSPGAGRRGSPEMREHRLCS